MLEKSEDPHLLEVLKQYALIDILNISKNTVGFVNKTYIVVHEHSRYVLRESNSTKTLVHLKFEVDVLNFLHQKKFSLTPQILPNIDGDFITVHNGKFYTLQNFLPGENKACWNDLTNFNDTMLESFFKAAAQFSMTVSDFPLREGFEDTTLFAHIMKGQEMFRVFFDPIPPSAGKNLLISHSEELFSFIEKTRAEMSLLGYKNLPQQIVHFDLHPGNVNFLENVVSGIFDFDWVRFDSRISDIAGTIAQACWQYGGKKSGLYNQDKIALGLRSYRNTYGDSDFSLEEENRLIMVGLQAYMFFQLLWSMDWYKDNTGVGNELVIETMVRACLGNDYETLFQFRA